MTIVNTTLTENTAAGYGGAVFSFPEQGDVLTIVNCTIVCNSAVIQGGGITCFDGTVNLHNTILYGNKRSDNSTPNNYFGVDACPHQNHTCRLGKRRCFHSNNRLCGAS